MTLITGPNIGVLISGAQGEAHYNEMLKFFRAMDGLTMPAVKAIQPTPPSTPSDGDLYIVSSSGTGAWAGKDQNLARYFTAGAQWEFFPPRMNWTVTIAGTNYCFNGTAWATTSGGTSGVNIQSGTSYTAQLTDGGGLIVFNQLAVCTVTIPNNSSVPFNVGTVIEAANYNTGLSSNVAASAAAGVTFKILTAYASGANYTRLVKIGTNMWLCLN